MPGDALHRTPIDRSLAGSEGYTLLELLIVLAIISCAAATAFHIAPASRDHTMVKMAAVNLATELRATRARALRTGHWQSLMIDVDRRTYHRQSAPATLLDPSLSLKIETFRLPRPPQASAEIRFSPDGQSTGGTITLKKGGTTIALTVDWLTGRTALAGIE